VPSASDQDLDRVLRQPSTPYRRAEGNRARTATAVTVVPSHLYVLNESDFTALLLRQPRIENRVLTTVAERMRYR